MNRRDLDKVYNLYSSIWKQRCKEFGKEPPISVIKNAPEKIVVIGDLHGDWNATINSLKTANLIKDIPGEKYKKKWIGADTILVQLGDQIDRCRLDRGPCHFHNATKNDEASDIKILEFFTELHKQASKKGGAVYSILGNHEMMNVVGDFKYVSRENLMEFSEDGTLESGINKRKKLFKPGNKYANFLACTRKVAMVIGKNLFIHAGIVPEIANKYKVKDINSIVALFLFDKLKEQDKYNDLLINPSTSPYWTRLLGNLNRSSNKQYISSICDIIFKSGMLSNLLGTKNIHSIERIFIGHTPQMLKGINTICNNKIYYMDVGVSQAFDSWDPNTRSKSRNFPVAEILNDDTINFKYYN
tara:strand:- start:350 stop:1423 length:1074 start_codon:yes stop_codon:yes gene_type:complete